MDWNKGIEARFYACFIDKDTWRNMDRFEITGGTISRSLGDLQESADIECIKYTQGERWVRVWLDARQNGASEHIPMFTGLATSPADKYNGRVVSNSLECYSVLKPCQDVLLSRGWYAPKGSGESVIRELLSVTPAPVEIEENVPRLQKNIIAESGESHLSMLSKVMLALNWRLKIKGDGTIQVCPEAIDPSASFGLDNDCIEPVFEKKYDWYECPNVFRAINGNESVVVYDDSPDSMLSTVSRGREIWEEDSTSNLNENESLYQYAKRRLADSQLVAQSVSYDRRYNPNLYVSDLVNLRYPDMNGLYYVISQRIEIGYGAKTTEEVVK